MLKTISEEMAILSFGILTLAAIAYAQDRIPRTSSSIDNNVLAEIQVVCHSDAIMLRMNTNRAFNGMIYPKGMSNNSTCMTEYYSAKNISYRLPLKTCNTMSSDVDDGVEYFNTVMVQPHMRLLTNQGKGYHIRCKYQTREKTIANTQFNVSKYFSGNKIELKTKTFTQSASFALQNSLAGSTPLLATASMPSCTMKIFRSGTSDDVAESVKIGDKLIMVIEIDQQDMYGMKITSCVVRDGLNLAEQPLINDNGCPLDETIMPQFEYSNNFTRSAVSFPAHKFPHTSSVYYQCNVRLCIKDGGCELPDCSNKDVPRRKRYVEQGGYHQKNSTKRRDPDMSFDVYSGLYVSDMDTSENSIKEQQISQVDGDHLCLPLGQLILAISTAFGLLILVAIIVIVLNLANIGFCKKTSSTRSSTSSYPFHSEQQSTTRSYFDDQTSRGDC